MGELVGQFLTPQVKFVLGIMIACIVLVYVASIIWVYRDARLRGARAEVWSIIAIIPLVGVILYWILRPAMYELDSREQELEIARRERELYTEGYCRACSYPVESDYLICPNCKVKLKKECTNCGKALKPKWDVCPYCRTKQGETPSARPAARADVSPEGSSSKRSTTGRSGGKVRSVTRRRKS